MVSDSEKWKCGHLKLLVLPISAGSIDTVKSDDVVGRAKTYESIVKGENMPTPDIPESFNVLVHELNGLGLKITFEQ